MVGAVREEDEAASRVREGFAREACMEFPLVSNKDKFHTTFVKV